MMTKLGNPITARSLLHQWVVEQNGRASPEEIMYDTPLLERRIITSLQIMELILFIERLRGASIDVRMIGPGSFSSIDAIMTHFFSEHMHG
jgi:acyl carrier protein